MIINNRVRTYSQQTENSPCCSAQVRIGPYWSCLQEKGLPWGPCHDLLRIPCVSKRKDLEVLTLVKFILVMVILAEIHVATQILDLKMQIFQPS